MTTQLTRKQVGCSTNSRGETCRQFRQDRGPTCKQLRHRRQHGTKPSGRRATGILSILQTLTTGEFFLRVSGRTVAPMCDQAAQTNTTWVMTRCSSSGCMDPATQLPLLTSLVGGKGSLELPYCPAHGVPGILRSWKQTWLVRILNEPDWLSDKPL